MIGPSNGALSARARAMAPIKACSEETCGFCLSAMANRKGCRRIAWTNAACKGTPGGFSQLPGRFAEFSHQSAEFMGGVSALTGAPNDTVTG